MGSDSATPKRADSGWPTSLDLDKLKTKMGLRTQVALIGAVVIGTAWAVTTYTGIATKGNVVDALQTHQTLGHTSTKSRITAVEKHDSKQDIEIAVIKRGMGDMDGIKARIEFLTQQTIIEAQESAPARRRVRAAAARVRAASKASGKPDDPLAGVDGL